ncbi:MAG: hypothetical protein R2820_07075 [Cyclobacteriaceae bacterium]
MREVSVVLVGLGNVNRSLLHILKIKQQHIQSQHGIRFSICGVADSKGIAVNKKGFDIDELYSLRPNGLSTVNLAGYIPNAVTSSIIKHINAELLVEASPVNLITGEPGLSSVKSAIDSGWKVVMANKGPLVMDFDGLMKSTKENHTRIGYSATVCGGLPVINVLKRDLKAASITEIKGIFNATSNFVLQEMEKGRMMQDAIIEAQKIGAAETDPSLDISGQDTANKLYIIMRSATDFSGAIKEIKLEGIDNVTAEQLSAARSSNHAIKLIATAQQINGQWQLSVKPESVPANSFLASCSGWEMGIKIKTDLYESISMKNYEADPMGTAAAVLRDMIDVFA